jgi:bacteriocin biosynthesis cyclodehydratase domain-containing protein
MQLELAPHVQAGLRGDTLIVGAGRSRVTATKPSEINALRHVLGFFLQPRRQQDIEQKLGSTPEFMNAYTSLRDSACLVSSNDLDVQSRYSRNALFFNLMGAWQPGESQQRLAEATVAIIGCGGIGNAVALQLATAGVGQLVLVDFDTVELSNLTRQYAFKEKHVGQKKTDVLARELSERNSEIRISSKELDLRDSCATHHLPSADLWVLSADSPSEIVFWVNRESIRRKIPYINVGYSADIAIWGPLVIPGETGCHECSQVYAGVTSQDSALSDLLKTINQRHRPASAGPINQLAAAFAGRDILNFLAGTGEVHSLNHRIGFYSHSLEIQKQNFSRSHSCEACSVL